MLAFMVLEAEEFQMPRSGCGQGGDGGNVTGHEVFWWKLSPSRQPRWVLFCFVFFFKDHLSPFGLL